MSATARPNKLKNYQTSNEQRTKRNGAIAVLTAVVLVVLLICVAIAVDIGSVMLVRTQLQTAADSSSLAAATRLGLGNAAIVAEAQNYGNLNTQLGGAGSEIAANEVEVGVWNRASRTFVPGTHGNAVRVTARGSNHGYFFAKMVGAQGFSGEAQAIAAAVPRDLIFVVDLSGSMNSDTEPAWSPNAVNAQSGVPAGTGEALLDDLYTDLYGGVSGNDFDLSTFLANNGFTVASPEYAYAVLTMDTGPLSTHPNSGYKINPGDTEATRKAKAYKWFREQIIVTQMPSVNPPISQTTYWNHYLDYVIRPMVHAFPPPNPPPPRPGEPQPPSPPNYGPCWVPPPHHVHHVHHVPSHVGSGGGHVSSHHVHHVAPHVSSHVSSHVASHHVHHVAAHHVHHVPAPHVFGGGPLSTLPASDASEAGQVASAAALQPLAVAPPASQELVAVSNSALQSAAIAGLAASASGGYYDPTCVANVDAAYNTAYNNYTIAWNHWNTVLIPAWEAAIDHYYNVYLPAYLAEAKTKGSPPYSRSIIPPNPPLNEYGKVDRIANVTGVGSQSFNFNNPNSDLTSLPESVPAQQLNKVGYKTYTQFQADFGRNLIPGVMSGQTVLCPLSAQSPYCPLHSESVGDADTGYESFTFPPREQPMHAARRSLIRAMKILKKWNDGVPAAIADRVGIVTFDGNYPSIGMTPTLVKPLTASYNDAMNSAAMLQPTGDKLATTAMEAGMIVAYNHMQSTAREFADKVVIVLSDGVPNSAQSSNGTINGYVSSVPSPDSANYYTSDPLSWSGSKYWFNGPLMQARKMHKDDHYDVYAVGLGFGADSDFLNRMANVGGTSGLGQGLQAGGDPSQYEAALTQIFRDIIFTPTVRLVD